MAFPLEQYEWIPKHLDMSFLGLSPPRCVGKAMVSQLAKGIPESIRAEIKTGNVASIRIAEDAGMAFEREEKGVLHYRRDAVAQPGSQEGLRE